MQKKDFKLYADECIEEDFIDHIRNCSISGFNVKSVKGEGLTGQPDEIILKRANNMRRFLLTYNAKDFFYNDKLCPFKGLVGIIALNFDKNNYPCEQSLWLSKHDKNALLGKKFLVSQDSIRMKNPDADGKIDTTKLDEENCQLCYFEDAK